jgi:F5/8 type C domain
MGVNVLTRSYDDRRTGSNLRETILNTTNVNRTGFAKLFELPVDDHVYAQILYVSDLAVAGRQRNVIFAATVNNTVYAFDADEAGPPLWQRNFNGAGRPGTRLEVGQNCGTDVSGTSRYTDYGGHIGIVGTPVIDLAARTMYFVSRTVEGADTVQRLRAVDIATGDERPGSPKKIDAAVPGSGTGSTGPDGAKVLAFSPLVQNQRMSLGLSEGLVSIGWSGFCDTGDYHGWLMAYDARTLDQVHVLNLTPDGERGGIWQSGAAPAFDEHGNMFVVTGNGTYDGNRNYGQSVLKLSAKTFEILDHFVPANFMTLNDQDWDLGSSGPALLPGTDRMIACGKEGRLFLLDVNDLGKLMPADAGIPQSFQAVDPTARPEAYHHLHNGAVVWRSPQGLNVYTSGENDYLRVFRYQESTKQLDFPATLTSSVLPPLGMPGGQLAISADGSKPGTGILWSTTPRVGDANQSVVAGVLRAYSAETLELLWDSTSPADDTLEFAKFNNPTVANGRVYVASFSNALSVYGLGTPKKLVNLALNKTARGSIPCTPTENAAQAFNGSTEGGNADKWCSVTAPLFLEVDLGASVSIDRILVRHAGAGGESFIYNTRDFDVLLSDDDVTFETVASVRGNVRGITIHPVTGKKARYVKVDIMTPSQDGGPAARIYELEVYGP